MVGLLHIQAPCAPRADGATLDPSALPARAGVVVFEAADARAVLVASCADLRAFAAARLGAQAAPGRADLRPVTARVRAGVVGSAIEGDIACLEIARSRLAATYRALADRWRGWFIHLDPDAQAPTWRKTDLNDLAAHPPAGSLLGPIADKDSAGRLGEWLDDVFDLCRFPRELALAPHGKPCAYKEMGRCPAACDGSEPLDAYRSRVRAAIALAVDGPETEIRATDAAMRAASEAHDFESAARLRARGEALAKWGKGPWAHTGPLDRFAAMLVLPGHRFGWARLIVLAGGSWHWLADVSADEAKRAWADIAPAVRTLRDQAAPFPFTTEAIERIGLVSRHWFKPIPRGHRRRATILDLRHWPQEKAVVKAIQAASAAGEEEPSEVSLEG